MAQSLLRVVFRNTAHAACEPLAQQGAAPTTQMKKLGFQAQIFPWLQNWGPPNL